MSESRLEQEIKRQSAVGVAFSGGCDSSYLLAKCHQLLGDGAVAFTIESAFQTREEMQAARLFCQKRGIRQVAIPMEVLADPAIRNNPPRRCYHCKKKLFSAIWEEAGKAGISLITDGTVADDDFEDRPGVRALGELGIRSFLWESGMTKEQVRAASRRMGLETWDKKPSPCLATRFPFGTRLEEEALRRMELAEEEVRGWGVARVRCHGALARLEAEPGKMEEILARRQEITSRLKKCGFAHVTLDLVPYGMGAQE